jgi:hypothetical protein
MAKQNGKMRLAGTVHVAGPDLIERLVKGEEVIFEEDHVEFCLKVSKAPADKIVTFSPLVWLDAADVKIQTDARDDDLIGEDLTLYLIEGKERSVGINVSVEQAEALARVLTNFVSMYRAKEELEKTISVNAA